MSEYQVGPGTFVTLKYQVFDAEGEPASQLDVIGFVFGMEDLLPGVNQAIEGKSVGDLVELTLSAEQAFGRRDPNAIVEVDRAEFPEGVAVGDRFEMENEDGGLLVVHILDVREDAVVMDTNHPLSEQEIRIQAEIQEVRPACDEEISAAEAMLNEDSEYIRAEVPDISPQSLIRKGS